MVSVSDNLLLTLCSHTTADNYQSPDVPEEKEASWKE